MERIAHHSEVGRFLHADRLLREPGLRAPSRRSRRALGKDERGDTGRPSRLNKRFRALSIWASPVRSWGKGGKCPPIMRRTTMAQYLLSVHSVEGEARDPMTEEDTRQ